MSKHRSYAIEFRRQVAQEDLAGETLHGLAKRHAISRNLVRIWVAKYEAGSFDAGSEGGLFAHTAPGALLGADRPQTAGQEAPFPGLSLSPMLNVSFATYLDWESRPR